MTQSFRNDNKVLLTIFLLQAACRCKALLLDISQQDNWHGDFENQ
jgi:hypothetical protein